MSTKKVGRPSVDTEMVRARMDRDVLIALDAYAVAQDDKPARPEAVRRLLREELSRLGYLRAGAPDEGKRPDELDATNDD